MPVAAQDPRGATSEIRRLGGHPDIVQVLVSTGGQRLYGHPVHHRSAKRARRSACRWRPTRRRARNRRGCAF
jgi:hypothetical protein